MCDENNNEIYECPNFSIPTITNKLTYSSFYIMIILKMWNKQQMEYYFNSNFCFDCKKSNQLL